jgi:TRAP-type mannitol/chloroaromatic compound transport system permease small subunit
MADLESGSRIEDERTELGGWSGRLVRVTERISEVSGQIFAWLVIPLMLALVYEVLARYLFNAPTRWAFDATYMLYGAHFMMLSAFTLKRGGHIRTDFLYQYLSPRWQGILDFTLYLFLFIPAVAILFWVSLEYAVQSWARLERGTLTPLMPPIYPLKSVIPLASLLLLLQCVAELIKSYYAATKGRWP